jgi:hypothetical protein
MQVSEEQSLPTPHVCPQQQQQQQQQQQYKQAHSHSVQQRSIIMSMAL